MNIPQSARIIRGIYGLLANWVGLQPGIPRRLHFTDYYYVDREILEKESGKPKRVRSLVFWTDEVDGAFQSASFSILSQKLASHLEPFLLDHRYRDYEFLITQMGDGFLKDFNVQTIKRA